MSATPQLTATGQPFDEGRARALLIIFAVMATMVTYVETMVLPAFKQFGTFFGLTSAADYGTIAWILSAYLLVGTVVVPIFGKLGDLYGKKRMLIIAMSVYAVAVTFAGFTPNIGNALGVPLHSQIYLLIGARAVQGIGMGMFPLAFAMIPEAFPKPRVGTAQGIISAMFATGAALGLAGGGWIAQTWGWQFTYHTVVPVAVILVVLSFLLLRESPKHGADLDLPGIASLGTSLALLLLGVTEGPYWGWTGFSSVSWGALPWGTPEFFILSAILFAFFVVWELRAPSPVIRFASLRPRNIWVSNVSGILVGLLMFFSFTAVVILAELPTFLDGLGVSELTFGLLAVPSAVAMMACGGVFGRAISSLGPKPVALAGYALIALGAVGLLFFNRAPVDILLFMMPLLGGNVANLIAMSNVIVLSVDRRELGVQTGMNQTFRNLGSAIAPVVTTSLLATFLTTYLVAETTPSGAVVEVPVSSYALFGFEVVFGLMAALAVVGFVLSLALKNYRFLADGTHVGHVEAASTSEGAQGTSLAGAPVAAGPRPVADPAAE
jgi:MFS family permease